ncbi:MULTISPECIES: NrtA/SsuA/CpmA family ABC transporter substrate-binding protein [unclassified Herbaspirillum]|uniref:NrtA/SsuA/CpmA family ABC transporter substrate-binding protein n=1 Tax=unclassified Herbaspirillum TaxID=2624150 RepID=UPI0011525B0F|nr:MULTISPECIES: NrtA/SsuA/CpmA family ABC transporter substrate-binding protein [unclassified Herbaspirillum]MBB5391490.1 sulfonate transport system substrate-binding protein [Herbaspirillum sp. SJZ102]TQK12826.1 sulfonate transport system substrate-binding protein [Herbaspirillum sp. SJZ130]TQK14830.1 sulfonate transport system substrate-binding protein [Herbaspirillum sp. SJZ106]TWC71081.1 sulfonate transport system substrate-binding protein [Herbaspirillum sp. SJZ099]
MSEHDKPANSQRRHLIQAAFAGAALGAAGLAGTALAAAGKSRNTDTVRLAWGKGGLPGIARTRGEFEKTLARDGIKVQWIGPFPNHAPSLQAVTGGSADFGFGGSTTPALAAMIAGSPLVFTQFAVVEPRSTAIIARDGSGIDKVADLVGKSVAVNRSGLGEFLLVAALEKHGIDRSKVKFVYLNPPDAGPAFSQGKVDAWSMWSPGVDIARVEYKAHDVFFEGRDLDFLIDFNSYVTHRKFAEENGDIVRAVNAAYRAEGEWITKNTKEAEILVQKDAGYSDAVRDSLIRLQRRWEFHGAGDARFIATFQGAADWLSERKILPQKVKVTDYIVNV